MKKGISTQIFIFIFALLMIVLVLGFGIRSLSTVSDTANNVELLTFIDTLDDLVQEYYVFDVGSSELVDLAVPKGVTHVCFSNPKEPISKSVPTDLAFFVQNNKKDNLYILPLDAYKAPAPDFTVAHMYVDPTTNPLCVATQGLLQVKLETVLFNNEIFVQITEV